MGTRKWLSLNKGLVQCLTSNGINMYIIYICLLVSQAYKKWLGEFEKQASKSSGDSEEVSISCLNCCHQVRPCRTFWVCNCNWLAANATDEQNFGQFLSMPSKNVVANETKKVDFGP